MLRIATQLDPMDDPRDERAELLADLNGLRQVWRLPTAPDGTPFQPTAEQLDGCLVAWDAAGLVAAINTRKYGPLTALVERHLFDRMEATRARLVELDAIASHDEIVMVMRAERAA
jgi:hypothetical protein